MPPQMTLFCDRTEYKKNPIFFFFHIFFIKYNELGKLTSYAKFFSVVTNNESVNNIQ